MNDYETTIAALRQAIEDRTNVIREYRIEQQRRYREANRDAINARRRQRRADRKATK
jgi:hypothetical protein